MNLYILRHASAGKRLLNTQLDLKRPLDKEGKLHCLLLGSVLSTLKVQVDCIVSSPLKRALQTASLVGTEIGYEQQIVIRPALLPAGSTKDFLALVKEFSTYENVLFVGHNPSLTQNIRALLCSSAQVDPIRLRKGAITKLDMSRRSGRLQWLIDPKLVRMIQASSTANSRPKTSQK
jgi:phosphohistidine phosphatase